jgi:hypothetical protein
MSGSGTLTGGSLTGGSLTGGTLKTPVLASRALGGSRRKRRSDQCWEVTDADLNMYGMIVGRAPSDAEKVAAIQKAKQRQEEADRRAAEEAERRPAGSAWSPAVLCSYLRGLCVGTVELRIGGPQFSGWVRQLSMQARQRIQESQSRLAGPRTR